MRLRVGLSLLLAFALLSGIMGAASSSIPYTGYSPIENNYACNADTRAFAINTPNSGATAAITLIALNVSFDVVALGYLFSKLVPASGISNWIKNEYYELTKSIIIVVIVYSMITMVSGLALAIAPIPSGFASTNTQNVAGISGLIDESEYYLCQVQGQFGSAWEFVGQVSFAIGLMQNIKFGFWLPLPVLPPIAAGGGFLTSGFSMQPYHSFMLESGNLVIQHFESTVFDLIQFVLFPVTAMIIGLEPLLPLLVQTGLMILIPLGLIFRAFPFIRGVGGTLIAMGIAISLIFPSTLILLDQPIAQFAYNLIPPPPSSLSSSAIACSGFFCHIINYLKSEITAIPNGLNMLYIGLQGFDGIYYFFNGMIFSNFYFIVQLLLLAIDLILIYQLTDSIAKALGGTIRLSLGNKLKLA